MNSYDVFVEVVELMSFSAAAKKLHRTPSAISKQISLLEQQLEIQLFNRTTRSLSITDAGQLYYERCKDISQRMEDAKSELKDLSGEPSGVINITWPNILSSSEVMVALGEFLKQHPDIRVNIDVSIKLLDLTEERKDFAFRLGQLNDSSLVAIELFKVSPLICCSPDIIKTHGQPRSTLEVFKLPHVVPSFLNIRQIARQKFPEIKALVDEETHIVNNITALYNMAKQGIGTAILFRHLVANDLQNGTLVELSEHAPLPEIPVYLVYPKLNYTPKRLRCFIDFFKQRFTF